VVPQAVTKTKAPPPIAPILATLQSNSGEILTAAARDAVASASGKLMSDPLVFALWKTYQCIFRLITWKLPCFFVSAVLFGGLLAGICLLAQPRLIAVGIMYLLRLIPELLQHVMAEMGSEFHSQIFGTAHCRYEAIGFEPQGPPVAQTYPAPHPPTQPPSWAPAMTFTSIMMVLLVGRHK